MTATMPRFVEMERRYGSVVKGLRAAENARAAKSPAVSGARWSLFQSFRNGMATLPETLVARLGGVDSPGGGSRRDVAQRGRDGGSRSAAETRSRRTL